MPSPAILYLNRQQYWFLSQPNQAPVSASWDGVHLTEVFSDLRKKSNFSSLNVLLGANTSYSTALKLDQPTRVEVLRAAAGIIPEDLDDHNFDWQRKGDYLQVVATSPFLMQALAFACEQTKLKLLATIPLSVLLAQETENQNQPTLVIWGGPSPQIVFTYQNLAFFCHPLEQLTAQTITDLISFSQTKLNLPIKQIIHNLAANQFPQIPVGLSVISQPLNPLAVLNQLHLTGPDADILNLQPAITPRSPSEVGKSSSSSLWPWLLFAILLVAFLSVALLILFNR